MPEIWKQIPGWVSYEASDLGRIRSLPRNVLRKDGALVWKYGKILLGKPNKDGYPIVTLSFNGKGKCFRVHQLVALTFIGPCPDGMEVNHIDCVKTNLIPSNLEYTTRKRNMEHAVENGRFQLQKRKENHKKILGEGHPRAKLDADTVMRIIQLRRNGMKINCIYHSLGIARAAVTNVLYGSTWSHITNLPKYKRSS